MGRKIWYLFIINLFLIGCSAEKQKDKDRRYACVGNMKEIYTSGLLPYANRHNNKLPKNLYTLFKQGYLTDINKFQCPTVTTAFNSEINSKEQFDEYCSYIYLGANSIIEGSDAGTIVLIENYNNHKNFICMLSSNGVGFIVKKKGLMEYCKRYNLDYQYLFRIWNEAPTEL